MKDGMSVGKAPEVSAAPPSSDPNVIYKSFSPIYGMGGKFPEGGFKSSAAGTPGKKDYEPAYSLKLTAIPPQKEGEKEAVTITYKSPGPPAVSRPATKAEAKELLDAFQSRPPKAQNPKKPSSAETDAIKQYKNAVAALTAYIEGPAPTKSDASAVPTGGYAAHPAAKANKLTFSEKRGR